MYDWKNLDAALLPRKKFFSKIVGMKRIIALIRPKKWTAIREALSQIAVERMTVSDVLGYADSVHGKFPVENAQYVQVVIVVNDDFLDRTVSTIEKVAKTGKDGMSGDGKIFVLPVDDTIQIKNGSRGKGAV